MPGLPSNQGREDCFAGVAAEYNFDRAIALYGRYCWIEDPHGAILGHRTSVHKGSLLYAICYWTGISDAPDRSSCVSEHLYRPNSQSLILNSFFLSILLSYLVANTIYIRWAFTQTSSCRDQPSAFRKYKHTAIWDTSRVFDHRISACDNNVWTSRKSPHQPRSCPQRSKRTLFCYDTRTIASLQKVQKGANILDGWSLRSRVSIHEPKAVWDPTRQDPAVSRETRISRQYLDTTTA